MKLNEFLKEQNIPYKSYELFEEAFTHPSYVNEAGRKVSHYERLEFMGDAVLQLFVSEHIFKKYPNVPEGSATTLRAKLVREESLAKFARELGLGKHIILGVGELKEPVPCSMLPCRGPGQQSAGTAFTCRCDISPGDRPLQTLCGLSARRRTCVWHLR